MSTEDPPDPPTTPPPDAPDESAPQRRAADRPPPTPDPAQQRRAVDRPPPPPDPSKAPVAVPVMGGLSVIVAMLTLCAGGLRLVKPEGAVGPEALGPIFEVALARNAIVVSMITWVTLSFLLAVAGGGLLLARPWGRLLGLVYAWTSVGVMALMIAGNAAFVAPSLDQTDVTGIDVFRAVLAGPSLGCCPIAFSLSLIVALHHDAVGKWAALRKRAR